MGYLVTIGKQMASQLLDSRAIFCQMLFLLLLAGAVTVAATGH